MKTSALTIRSLLHSHRVAGTWGYLPWQGDGPADNRWHVLDQVRVEPAYTELERQRKRIEESKGRDKLSDQWAWIGTLYVVADSLHTVPRKIIQDALDMALSMPDDPAFDEYVATWKAPKLFLKAHKMIIKDLEQTLGQKGDLHLYPDSLKEPKARVASRFLQADYKVWGGVGWPGSKVVWHTVGGERFAGRIVEWDNGTVIVDCHDGVRRAVGSEGLVLAEHEHLVKWASSEWGDDSVESYTYLIQGEYDDGVKKAAEWGLRDDQWEEIEGGDGPQVALVNGAIGDLDWFVSRHNGDLFYRHKETDSQGEWAPLYKHFSKKGSAARVTAKFKKKKEVPKADGKGTTTVYEYSEKQVQHRNREKAKKVEKLRQNIDKLRSQVKKDLASKDPKTQHAALAVALMDETYERVGNEESAKDGHFGVTNWQVEHVSFGSGTATIKYVGKSGVDHEKKVSNTKIVKALREAAKDKKKGDCILDVKAQDVNAYLKPHNVTAKDIRGLHANEEMKTRLKEVRSKGGKLPTDPKEREKKLKEEFKKALEGAAEAVGHEASTLRSQYLVPGLEDSYVQKGKVMDRLDKKGSGTTLAVGHRLFDVLKQGRVWTVRDRRTRQTYSAYWTTTTRSLTERTSATRLVLDPTETRGEDAQVFPIQEVRVEGPNMSWTSESGTQFRSAALYDNSHPETMLWVRGFFSRHPSLGRYSRLPVVHVDQPNRSRHPEASWTSRGIELYPKFRALSPDSQDFVFAHEIGHAVLEKWDYRKFMAAAEAAGIDPWDTPSLPFAQHNFDEAFADSFASYHLDQDVQRRYPGWAQIVESALAAVKTAGRTPLHDLKAHLVGLLELEDKEIMALADEPAAVKKLARRMKEADEYLTGKHHQDFIYEKYARGVLEFESVVMHLADGGYSRMAVSLLEPKHLWMDKGVSLPRAVEQWEAARVARRFLSYGDPKFGPNTPLMEHGGNRVKYRMKSSTNGVAVAVYYGRSKIGGMNAFVKDYPETEKACSAAVWALLERYPQVEDTSRSRWVPADGVPRTNTRALQVYKAFITDDSKQGLGIGRAMYLALMAEWFDKVGPFLFMPMACSGSGTSAEALRVWKSLARDFPSSGNVIAVLRRPQLPAEVKLATKDDHEIEDEEVRRTLRRDPEKKPPRHDLRRRRVEERDPDEPTEAEKRKDKHASARVASEWLVQETLREFLGARRKKKPRKPRSKKPSKTFDERVQESAEKLFKRNQELHPESKRTLEDFVEIAREKLQDKKPAEPEDSEMDTLLKDTEEKAQADAKAETDKKEKERRDSELQQHIQDAAKAMGVLGEDDSVPDRFKAALEERLSKLSDQERKEFAQSFGATIERLKDSPPDVSVVLDFARKARKSKIPDEHKEMGVVLADKLYAENVVFNPTNIGDSPMSDDGKTKMSDEDMAQHEEARRTRSEQAFKFAQDLTPEEKKDLADQVSAEMEVVDPKSKRGRELMAVYYGIALSEAAEGREPPKLEQEDLQIPSSESFVRLVQALSQSGREVMLLGAAEDLTSPSGRNAIRDSLESLGDDQLSEFVVQGSPLDSVMQRLRDDAAEEDPKKKLPEKVRAELRKVILDSITDNATLLDPLVGEYQKANGAKAKAKAKFPDPEGFESDQADVTEALLSDDAESPSLRDETTAAQLLTKLRLDRMAHWLTEMKRRYAKEPTTELGKRLRAQLQTAVDEGNPLVLDQRVVARTAAQHISGYDFVPWTNEM